MWEIRDFTKVLGRWLEQVLGILVLLVGVVIVSELRLNLHHFSITTRFLCRLMQSAWMLIVLEEQELNVPVQHQGDNTLGPERSILSHVLRPQIMYSPLFNFRCFHVQSNEDQFLSRWMDVSASTKSTSGFFVIPILLFLLKFLHSEDLFG